jgi:Zn-finger nucleic acid-binding protein
MNCPACDHDLSARTLDNVTVDVCDGGCGGIWLDAFELARVDEELPCEIRDIAKDPKLVIDNDRKRPCPRCDGIKMQRHFYSSAHRVEVDSCPGCGGYWLDAGELSAIREDVKKPKRADGPVRVQLTEKKSAKTVGGSGLSQADRACTLDSLYRIIGSKY